MPPRNVTPHTVNAWRGLNTFISRNNVDEQSWIDANNILVNAKGEIEALRSPKAFSTALSSTAVFTSMDEYQRAAGNVLILDRNSVAYSLTSSGGAPAAIVAAPSSPGPWTSLSINDTLQRINGVHFVQILNNLTSVVRNGIDPPAAAPTIAYAVNASDTTVIASSLQGSYCYYNSTTGHVSAPSPLSNVLGPKAAGFDVTFAVTASAQTGVDKVIFFLTEDGGSIPYLVIDCSSSDPHTATNTTATKTIVQSDVDRDTLTPEPIYNDVPPVAATSMFEFKDRIFLIVDGGLRYSGFESCYIGNDYESWPALNQLNVPNRNDRAIGGISTQSGALIFGEKDCYILTGFPSDKTSSPNNTVSVTEHIDPLNWHIGITYPKTAVSTPFGVIWTDQTKRIRLWNQQGFPAEIAQALRTELDSMTGTLQARWFQHGKNGGYYVLTNGTITLFIMIYLSMREGQMEFGYGKSTTILPEAMAVATFSGIEKFFYADAENVWRILDPDTAGDGWGSSVTIFFKILVGGQPNMNFSSLHSIQISGDMDDLDLAVTHAPYDEVSPETIELTEVLDSDTGGTFYGLIDSDERRYHILSFSFENDDRTHRGIDSLTVNVRNAQRLI